MKLVTLTTDFGQRDAYVASMKGVILSIHPGVTIVDVTNEVPPQDVRKGRSVLQEAFRCFPRETVHLAVVDPGVGTDRRAIAVQAFGHWFVGPDNGLFGFVKDDPAARYWSIPADAFGPRETVTFDGRDLFAPLAAHLAGGATPERWGTPIESIRDLVLPQPTYGKDVSEGEVIEVDRFGNLITNLEVKKLGGGTVEVWVNETQIGALRRTYGAAAEGGLLALGNSTGHLEIAVHRGSAEAVLKVSCGGKVIVRRAKK